MNGQALCLIAACLLAVGSSACSRPPVAPVSFEDATSGSGLEGASGMTHGVAWGDVDGDGNPDIYLTNHLRPPQLLRNLGHGRFEDVTAQWFAVPDQGGDRHGAAWADLDNNGLLDLVQLTGAKMGVGEEPKQLFINTGKRLEDRAAALGVLNPLGRTRMPLWLDIDADGRLDLIQGAETRFDEITPPLTFLQKDGHFQPARAALEFRSRTAPFCIVTALDQDHHPEAVCRVAGNNLSAQIFSTGSVPTRNLNLLPVSAFEDIAAGDFDNDGKIDLFLARKNPPGTVAFGRPTDNVLITDFSVRVTELDRPKEVSFRTQGNLEVIVAPKEPHGLITTKAIRIGKAGASPPGLAFPLDGATATGSVEGAAGDVELRFGFQPPDHWRIALIGLPGEPDAKGSSTVHVQVRVTAAEPIREVSAAGDAERPEEAPQRLFMNRGDRLDEESDKRGINEPPISAMNVVAADFNNDMLLDLFILGSGDIGMHGNQLLLNAGKGEFERHPLGNGANGPLSGVGDSVTSADFDGDGFVDLLVATGGSMGRSLGLPSDDGVYRLFRNKGNGNRWLKIDLEGTRSNRDGIGARVQVSAGDITQTRVQDGGIHHRSQNDRRLHFGLGSHERATKVVVLWPSGALQELANIRANQVLRIREPTN